MAPPHGMDAVPAAKRLLVLDVLRGWAVFGMVVVNVGYFSRLGLGGSTGADGVAAGFVQLLASGKFWTLFSVLFGIGFAMQLDRATVRGAGFATHWIRRVVVLLAIGLAHTLLHPLEILHRYAVLGLLLLPLRRAGDGALIFVAVLTLLLPPLVQGLGSAPAETSASSSAEAAQTYTDGSIGAVVTYNRGRFVREAIDIRVLSYFPYLLLGVLIGRWRLLDPVDGHLPLVRRARWPLLALGIGGQALGIALAVLAPPAAGGLARTVLDLGSGCLGLFYACLIVLAVQRVGRTWWVDSLAAVGRLALTNYLLQTVIVTTLLYGYGGGLYGQIDIIAGVGLACAVYLLQVVGSRWWLTRYTRGPVEALWRRLTYGRPPVPAATG